MSKGASTSLRIAAARVRQWLPEWDDVVFDDKQRRRKPQPHFFLLSIQAGLLRRLSGISRRSTDQGLRRSEDLGIQRRHDASRSRKIHEFVHFGYPWCDLGSAQRSAPEYDDLRKPGWLPTAIVINILQPTDSRRGVSVSKEDLVLVDDAGGKAEILVPSGAAEEGWRPKDLHPIEIIDGQHRLWAFEDGEFEGDFDFPVVAFYGLDISWQAYLFWTINITPKRINPSLAFDLYPLLRTEDWLEKFEGPGVYRETRAQELTENLWSYPGSPWFRRINMLGEPGLRGQVVTQAAWIRSLLSTYVKSWEGRGVAIGGLFGAPVGQHHTVLPWSRTQQAAFLIFVWEQLRIAIEGVDASWAKQLRKKLNSVDNFDLAFAGPATLLNTDQGVRGVLAVSNDLCYVKASDLQLSEWTEEDVASSPSEESISRAIDSLKLQPVAVFIESVTQALARFDWRTSAAPGLTEEERLSKAALRGSGGYKELRRQLLKEVAERRGTTGAAAVQVLQILKY
jgi:hypothetical protein